MKKLLIILCFFLSTIAAKSQVVDTTYQTGNHIDSVTKGRTIAIKVDTVYKVSVDKNGIRHVEIALKTLYGIVYIRVFQDSTNCITMSQVSAYGFCIPDVVIEWPDNGTIHTYTITAMQQNTDYQVCMSPIDYDAVVWVHAIGSICFSNYVAIRLLHNLPVKPIATIAPIQDSLINVFPNPNNGRFTIAINQHERQDYDIDIVNNVGKERIINLRQATKQNVIVEGLSSGYYFIKIANKTKHHSTTFKVIVQ